MEMEMVNASPEFIGMLRKCSDTLDTSAKHLVESYESDSEQFIGSESVAFPPRKTLDELQMLLEIFFPKYFNAYAITIKENTTLLKQKLASLAWIMFCGIRPYYPQAGEVCRVLQTVFAKIAEIREKLKKDVAAAYTGDPACTSYTEVIRCYPGFGAIVMQRVAHVLYEAGTPVYPRELTELAHRHTGVDIHPGATIGEYFFIDHATGTVIGETAVIGDWCRIYQSVTIGALHFAHDAATGMLRKGYKRHPTIGSNVVIGSGAKLLGAIKIGDNVSIGANAWLQEDVPDNTAVFIKDHPQQVTKVKKPSTPPLGSGVVTSEPSRVSPDRAPSGLAKTPEPPK